MTNNFNNNDIGNVNQNDGASQQAAPVTDNIEQIQKDQLSELREALYNTDGKLNFIGFKPLASIQPGQVLVSQLFGFNKFYMSRKDRSLLNSTKSKRIEKKKVTKTISKMLSIEIDTLLKELKNRANIDKKAQAVIALLEIEKEWRSGKDIERPKQIFSSPITFEMTKIIRERNTNMQVEGKISGLKIRWIWHPKAIKVPLETFILDTKSDKINVQDRSGQTVLIDVDFGFEIVEPAIFIRTINGKGRNGIEGRLKEELSHLDQLVYDYVRVNGIDQINTEDDYLETFLDSTYDKIEKDFGLRFHIVSKRVQRDPDFVQKEKELSLAKQEREIAENKAAAREAELRPELDAKKREAEIQASISGDEYGNLLASIKKNNPNLTEEEINKLAMNFRKYGNGGTFVDLGLGGVPFVSPQPTPQQVQPQRQIVNNYSDDEIQNFVSLGICCQGGYLSTEDSINLCQSRGISFEGVVFHVGELNYFEMQALINSKKGPTR